MKGRGGRRWHLYRARAVGCPVAIATALEAARLLLTLIALHIVRAFTRLLQKPAAPIPSHKQL